LIEWLVVAKVDQGFYFVGFVKHGVSTEFQTFLTHVARGKIAQHHNFLRGLA